MNNGYVFIFSKPIFNFYTFKTFYGKNTKKGVAIRLDFNNSKMIRKFQEEITKNNSILMKISPFLGTILTILNHEL
jgi:hypothetical protein